MDHKALIIFVDGKYEPSLCMCVTIKRRALYRVRIAMGSGWKGSRSSGSVC